MEPSKADASACYRLVRLAGHACRSRRSNRPPYQQLKPKGETNERTTQSTESRQYLQPSNQPSTSLERSPAQGTSQGGPKDQSIFKGKPLPGDRMDEWNPSRHAKRLNI